MMAESNPAGAEQLAEIAALMGGEERPEESPEHGDEGGSPEPQLDESTAQPGAPSTPASDDAGDPLAEVELGDLGVTPAGDDAPAPDTFEALAERLGIEVAELYKVAVPMRDGAEPITLGEMKDRAAEAEGIELRAAELEDVRSEFENQMIRSRQELAEIIKLLPQVPAALIERAQAAQAETFESERRALLEIKPEWADDSVFQAAKSDIAELGAVYGFGRADVDAIVDHRLIKLLHDFVTLRGRVEAATQRATTASEATARQGRRLSPGQQKRGRQSEAASRAKQTGKLGDQVAAVSTLIAGD